jgi:hypothetical protein
LIFLDHPYVILYGTPRLAYVSNLACPSSPPPSRRRRHALTCSLHCIRSLRKYSTANSARTLPVAFPFFLVNALATKPNRNKGTTEIRGPYYFPVTRTYLQELLSDWGKYVDGIKFAGGSSSLQPEKRLRDLIEVAHKHGALGLHLYPTASIPDGPSFLPKPFREHWRLY